MLLRPPERFQTPSTGQYPGFASEVEALVASTYQLVLKRAPNQDERKSWTDQVVNHHVSLARLVETILTSPEATQDLHLGLERELESLVVSVYQRVLKRAPQPDERKAWTDQLLSHHLSLAELVEVISSSAEASQGSLAGRAHAIESLVARIYQYALDRTPTTEERQLWSNEVISNRLDAVALIETIATSPEAEMVKARKQILPDVPNGRFIQFAYEQLLGRGAMADEIANWDYRFNHEPLGRDRFVLALFSQRAAEALAGQGQATSYDPSFAHVMGTDKSIGIKDWQEHADAVSPDAETPNPKIYPSLAFSRDSRILVSAIASLYRGGEYIEQFLENITTQTIFESCELIIIDADSPENEFEVIASYMKHFPNIVYHRAPSRIGIYEAWNLGVQMSRGRYLTNTNLDDLRRRDSFERQVEILEKFSFVDVAYQDFLYSFDGKASVEQTAKVGIRSEVPIVTPYNLLRSNSPHNAPMWRRNLHDDVGMFDVSYRSAGDYDFWLRCVQKGKVFFKINDPHVVYFVNPEGLSTQPNTRGIDEGNRITRQYGRALTSPMLLSDDKVFLDEASHALGARIDLSESDRTQVDWRYAAFQRALRSCSIASRSSHLAEE
jgi:GT2 family glycosyltransferase